MPYMFYNNLGNNAFFAVDGSTNPVFGMINPGPFINLTGPLFPFGDLYRTGTEIDATTAFHFLSTGGQNDLLKIDQRRIWMLADGNIAVPIPAAVWLLGSALGLLVWMRRRGRNIPAI